MSERASCASCGPSLSPSTGRDAGLKPFPKDNLYAGGVNGAELTSGSDFVGCAIGNRRWLATRRWERYADPWVFSVKTLTERGADER
jgi:hypothetical protein